MFSRRFAYVFSAVLTLSLPLVAQSVSPPVMLPGDNVPAGAAGRRESPQIARGSNGYLVVWADNRSSLSDAWRNGPYQGGGLGNMIDIYASRLDLNGNVIDINPIVISNAPYNQAFPRVAWNGQNWLVTWMTERETDRYYTDIMAARVSPGGAILDSPPLLIDSGQGLDQHNPWSISSDGTNWVVIWRDLDNGIFTVDGARISPTGAILDAGGKRLRKDVWNSGTTNADLAVAGDEYLLVFEEWAGTANDGWVLNAQRLNLSLDPIGSVFRVNSYSPTDAHQPAVASNGTDFLVVWFEDKWYGWAQVFGARVSHAGAVLDPNGIAITDYSAYTQFEPDVIWDGVNYFVAHNRNDDIYITRVTAAGTVLDPSGKPVKTSIETEIQPAIAAAPSGGAHVAWNATPVATISASSVSSTGTAGADRVVSLSVPRQGNPRAATSGDEYLLVFRSEIAGEVRIMAHRLDSAGNPLTPEPILIVSGRDLRTPAAAWNGLHYFVVWENRAEGRGQIYGRRLTKAGALLDASPISIMTGNQPDVAALGTTFLVVDTDEPINHRRFTQSVRVDANGTVLGPPVILGVYYDVWPRTAAVGNRWLVVWEQNATHDNPSSSIAGAFVNSDGTSGGQFNVSDGGYDDTPHLSAGADTTLIVWEEGDIFGRRIRPDGALLDTGAGIVISNAPQSQFMPAVAWEGVRWVTDHVDHRNEAYPEQPRGDIFGSVVDVNGIALDPNGFVVANSLMPEDSPTVAALSGAALFCYATYSDAQATMRLAVRTMSSAPPAPPPAPPGNLTAAAVSSSAIDLAWTDQSNNESGFRIERCVASGCTDFSQIAEVGANVTVYSSIGLVANTTYAYRVRAFSEGGNSSYSNVSEATTLPPPAAPTNVTASPVSGCQIHLTWTDNSADEDGFAIDRCTGSGCTSFGEIARAGANATSYGSTGLTTSTTYTYRVRAFNAGGSSEGSNTTGATTFGAPAPPANLAATAISGNRIDLAWTDNATDEDGFNIDRCVGPAVFCDSPSGYWIYWADTRANATSYADNFVSPGTTYSYRVRGFRCGGASASSNTDDATTPAAEVPASPTNLAATAVISGNGNGKNAYVDLLWQDNSSDETSFKLQRCAGETCADFATVAVVGANATAHRDGGLSRRTYYRYRVIASSSAGDSAPSNIAAAGTH